MVRWGEPQAPLEAVVVGGRYPLRCPRGPACPELTACALETQQTPCQIPARHQQRPIPAAMCLV